MVFEAHLWSPLVDHITNVEILHRTSKQPLSKIVVRLHLTLCGHLARMKHICDTSCALHARVPGSWKRPKGMQCSTSISTVGKYRASLNICFHTALNKLEKRNTADGVLPGYAPFVGICYNEDEVDPTGILFTGVFGLLLLFGRRGISLQSYYSVWCSFWLSMFL